MIRINPEIIVELRHQIVELLQKTKLINKKFRI
jgi:hypothetical protein